MSDSISLNDIYREYGISQPAAKRLLSDIECRMGPNNAHLYFRHHVSSILDEYVSLPETPPEGYASIPTLASMLNISKKRIYPLINSGRIASAGKYRPNGTRELEYFNVQEVVTMMQSVMDKHIELNNSFGYIHNKTLDLIKTFNQALDLARA